MILYVHHLTRPLERYDDLRVYFPMSELPINKWSDIRAMAGWRTGNRPYPYHHPKHHYRHGVVQQGDRFYTLESVLKHSVSVGTGHVFMDWFNRLERCIAEDLTVSAVEVQDGVD